MSSRSCCGGCRSCVVVGVRGEKVSKRHRLVFLPAASNSHSIRKKNKPASPPLAALFLWLLPLPLLLLSPLQTKQRCLPGLQARGQTGSVPPWECFLQTNAVARSPSKKMKNEVRPASLNFFLVLVVVFVSQRSRVDASINHHLCPSLSLSLLQKKHRVLLSQRKKRRCFFLFLKKSQKKRGKTSKISSPLLSLFLSSTPAAPRSGTRSRTASRTRPRARRRSST